MSWQLFGQIIIIIFAGAVALDFLITDIIKTKQMRDK